MVATLLGVVILLINIMIWVIIVQAVFSWLVAFNVINTYNDGMRRANHTTKHTNTPTHPTHPNKTSTP